MTPSELATLLLFTSFFLPLALAWLINKHPDLIAKGQDAAGRGMAIGCTSILLMIVSALLALAAAILVAVQHKHMAITWNILGLLPLSGSLIAALIIYTNIIRAKDRRARLEYEHAMSIPAALIVDDDDARFSKLYNALRPAFPTLEISMRHPGALYWQQQEWFPRLRLLMLSAEAMLITEGQTGELTQDLLAAMARAKPAFPILLHAQTPAAAESIRSRLSPAGWTIQAIIAQGDDWIHSQWRDHAVRTLNEELSKRPAPPEHAKPESTS